MLLPGNVLCFVFFWGGHFDDTEKLMSHYYSLKSRLARAVNCGGSISFIVFQSTLINARQVIATKIYMFVYTLLLRWLAGCFCFGIDLSVMTMTEKKMVL